MPRLGRSLAVSAALLACCATAVAQDAGPPTRAVLRVFRPENVPRISSSPSTRLLTQTLVMHGLAWRYRRHEPEELHEPAFLLPDDLSLHPRWRTEIMPRLEDRDAGDALASLRRGESDLAFIARPPTDEERQLAADVGVELDVVPIAWDALVLLAHRGNPAGGLTLAEVRRVYSGERANWPAAAPGQPEVAIVPLRFTEGHEMNSLFVDLVMHGQAVQAPPRPPVASTLEMLEAVASNQAAVGYALMGDLSVWPHAAVHTLAVDGVPATAESIDDGSYPLRTMVYVVTRRDTGRAVVEFRQWMSSARGRRAIRDAGFVPVRVQPVP